ncbi:hypothetical protein [Campylobacter jejuni]|uniref:hypothetical protein n=1 Tax=Campylobacter jejuni TaxID=197 RepID=UPI003A84F234
MKFILDSKKQFLVLKFNYEITKELLNEAMMKICLNENQKRKGMVQYRLTRYVDENQNYYLALEYVEDDKKDTFIKIPTLSEAFYYLKDLKNAMLEV